LKCRQIEEKKPIRKEVAAASRLDKNIRLLKKPSRLRSHTLEAHFRLFLAAINRELLSMEFQFVELGRQVGEFDPQHPA
jgi:hypothetical protein